MNLRDGNETQEFVATRAQAAVLFVICAFLLAGSTLVWEDQAHDVVFIGVMLLFAYGALHSLCALVRPMHILLDRNGFTVSGGCSRNPTRWAWREVSEFRNTGYYGNRIAYKIVTMEASGPERLTTKTRRKALDGDCWRLPASELIDLLNAYRSRALALSES